MNTGSIKALIRGHELVSPILKAISHPARLKILCCLLDGGKSVNELCIYCDCSQSATSQFLGRMKLEGLVESERNGKQVVYKIKNEKIKKLMTALKEIFCN